MTADEKRTYEAMADSLFDAYNAQVGNALPKVPVVMASGRMTRAAGRFQAYHFARQAKERTAEVIDNRGRKWFAHIRLSPAWIDRGFDQDILVETLKHEMAHLWELVTRGVCSHGPTFRMYCLRLGCNPAQYHSIGSEDPAGNHVYYCPRCGEITRFKRFVTADSDGGVCVDCSVETDGTIRKQYIGQADNIQRLRLLTALGEYDDLRSIPVGANLAAASEEGR